MRGSDSTDQYLGSLSEDILRAMIQATEQGSGLTRADAVSLIREANARHEDRFWSEEPEHFTTEVESVLDNLLDRGYLFEAAGELRVTDHDVLE